MLLPQIEILTKAGAKLLSLLKLSTLISQFKLLSLALYFIFTESSSIFCLIFKENHI
jgi:hypothetical protein